MASSHGSKDPPPPFPPKTRKDDIFVNANYSHVDEYVEKIPQSLYYDTLEDLVSYLTSNPEWNDMTRVRAIFRWVTSADVFELQHSKFQSTPPFDSPMNYIWKLQQDFKTVTDLMADLCQLADIPCIIVDGMVKRVTFETGEAVDRKTMEHCWNAVYVDGCWRLLDALWASCGTVGHASSKQANIESDGVTVNEEARPASEGVTQHRIDEFYFLTDPDQFIWSHFPYRKKWQLLEKPVTLEQFQSHFDVGSRFYILGMSCIESTKIPCVVETKDGEVEFSFGLPPTQSSNYRFQYELYRSKSENDKRKLLDRFVLYEQRDELLRFVLRFPIEGTFKFEISGLDVTSCDVARWCCIYIIKCPVAKQKCLPLPDCPVIGWGPVSSTKATGLIPVTHKQAEIVSKDGFVESRLEKKIATGVDENDALLLKAMQQLGEFEAKAAESRRNLQSAIHLKDATHLRQAIRNFIATGVDKNNALLLKAKQRLEELEAKAAYSKRIARRNLQSAMDLKDEGHLRQAIRKFAAAGVDENDALLLKAQQLLEVLEAKRG